MDKYEDEEDDLPTRNLSTTDDEENDETKDIFETDRPPHSAA